MRNNEFFNVSDHPFEEADLPLGNEEDFLPSVDYTEDSPQSGDYTEDCKYSCSTIDDFIKLTDEMMEDIQLLEEELVRWRQALIKYLPERWAEGLRQDIFNNTARGYDGDPAYDIYVQAKGYDPQQSDEHVECMQRLADGTDKTSITYL